MAMALMVSCCLPLNLSTANQKYVFMSNGKQSKLFMWALVSGKGVRFIFSPFHNLHELDRQAQSNQ